MTRLQAAQVVSEERALSPRPRSGAAEGHWRTRLGDRWRRALGRPVERDLGRYAPALARIHELWRGLERESDGALLERARRLRAEVTAGASLEGVRLPLFALAHEAAVRALGLRPFDEQILAGLAMSAGKVVEMATGEGKTLAAVAPVAFRALAGRGAHVLTFNDYLAERDAAWMGPLYRRLGLEVGHVGQGMSASQRRAAYAADVTYVTAKEAGFDYLRDGLALEPGQRVQRPFAFALVDEADSILIDEARIPLVIAAPDDELAKTAAAMAELVRPLRLCEDFEVHHQNRNISLTEGGVRKVEAALGCENLYAEGNQNLLADLRNALHAFHLLHRDVDYIVRAGKVELVDDFTGRVAERRQWPDGLQAAVEAKEQVACRDDGRILGSITVQHFVAGYPELCGMTGTAVSAVEEFHSFYGLAVTVVPTHAPCRRQDEPDRVFASAAAKNQALVQEIVGVAAAGRPILVGTASVRESEALAARLAAAGVRATVLNAKNDALEAEIVARAGAPKAVTISTNMAGRGTDIRLGGPDERERAAVMALGGLCVIGTNRHTSVRVDLQLRGRAGRQGDPGTSRFFVSLDDPLIETYGVRDLLPRRYRARVEAGSPQGPLEDPLVARTIAQAQRIIEGTGFDIRQRLWRYSAIVERQRQVIDDWRAAVLAGQVEGGLLSHRSPARWQEVLARFGAEDGARLERRLTLLALDRAFSDHLAFARRVRDEIPMVGLAGKDPYTEYCREVGAAFAELRSSVDGDTVARFEALSLPGERIDWNHPDLLGPSSTWTYLVHDEPFGANGLRALIQRPALAAFAGVVLLPLLVLWTVIIKWRQRRRRLPEGPPDPADGPELGS